MCVCVHKGNDKGPPTVSRNVMCDEGLKKEIKNLILLSYYYVIQLHMAAHKLSHTNTHTQR